jgi:hypothetical protein
MSTHAEHDFHLLEGVRQFCVSGYEQRNFGGTNECESCYVIYPLQHIDSSTLQGSSHKALFLTYTSYYLHGALLTYILIRSPLFGKGFLMWTFNIDFRNVYNTPAYCILSISLKTVSSVPHDLFLNTR